MSLPVGTVTVTGRVGGIVTGTTVPNLVTVEASQEVQARAAVRTFLDGTQLISLQNVPRPSGQIVLVYAAESDASAAVELHRTAETLTITDPRPDSTLDGIVYVSLGARLNIDRTSRARTVEVRYQEVTP